VPTHTGAGKLWGKQYPFERNHLQRSTALVGLGGVLAVTLILLVHANMTGALGIAFIYAGGISALAALSRDRYVRETRRGFAVLSTRGGGFVLGSALGFAVVGLLVALLVTIE
jgi:MFS family permease